MPINVRSQNVAHMIENLNSYSFSLTADEIKTLNSGPQAAKYMKNPFPTRPAKQAKSFS